MYTHNFPQSPVYDTLIQGGSGQWVKRKSNGKDNQLILRDCNAAILARAAKHKRRKVSLIKLSIESMLDIAISR